MLTCPWCGTNYVTFQSNCTHCGGPLPLPAANGLAGADEPLPRPPLPPRPIADRYIWRLLSADGAAIVGFVFILLGLVFTVVGVVMLAIVLSLVFARVPGASIAAGVTTLVGLPFAIIGPVFLIVGGVLGVRRYTAMRQIVRVMREGQSTEGRIVSVQENFHVRVNYRHPWIIRYQFHLGGRDFAGQVTTLNVPGAGLQAGNQVRVLYLPDTPQHNALYPHP